MDAEQAVAVCKLSPEAVVVATHLYALDHATVGRDELRRFSLAQRIAREQLLIPADGETLVFAAAHPATS